MKFRIRTSLTVVLISGIPLAGCIKDATKDIVRDVVEVIISAPSSTNTLNASEIEVDMSVIVTDSKATARVTLAETVTPDEREIPLGNNDALYVEPDVSARVRLLKNSDNGYYEAEFALTDFISTFNFSLVKFNQIIYSLATVPDIFSITFPTNNAVFGRASSIQVTWDNPDALGVKQLSIFLSLTCNGIEYGHKKFGSILDDGEHTIPSAEIQGLYPDGIVVNVACDVLIDVTRREDGTANPSLHGYSDLYAERSDSVTVTISPN